jgi:hypothetical protein
VRTAPRKLATTGPASPAIAKRWNFHSLPQRLRFNETAAAALSVKECAPTPVNFTRKLFLTAPPHLRCEL